MSNKQIERPFRSSIPEEKLVLARKMREGGTSYQRIAKALGVNHETLRCALDPEMAVRARRRRQKWRESNPEYNRQYREDNKERISEYDKQYHKNNRERRLEYGEQWHKSHPEYYKQWYKDHRGRRLEYNRQWRENNPEYNRQWCENHGAERSAYSAKRRASKRNATIGDPEKIAEIYRQAEEDSGLYCYICGELIDVGQGVVDHIFPISKHFAHAPFNLIPTHAKCNGEKSDKMPRDVEIYDRGVVERARQGHNLVLFWKILRLILELRARQIREVG